MPMLSCLYLHLTRSRYVVRRFRGSRRSDRTRREESHDGESHKRGECEAHSRVRRVVATQPRYIFPRCGVPLSLALSASARTRLSLSVTSRRLLAHAHESPSFHLALRRPEAASLLRPLASPQAPLLASLPLSVSSSSTAKFSSSLVYLRFFYF